MPLYLYKYLGILRASKSSYCKPLFIKGMTFKNYYKVETIETFKEMYSYDFKELHFRKRLKKDVFLKNHVQSLIEAKLLNPNKVKSWVNPF